MKSPAGLTFPSALRRRWQDKVRGQPVTTQDQVTHWAIGQLLSDPRMGALRRLSLGALMLMDLWTGLTSRANAWLTGISTAAVMAVLGWVLLQQCSGAGTQGFPLCALLGLALLPLLTSWTWMVLAAPVAAHQLCRAYRELRALTLQAAALLLVKVRRWMQWAVAALQRWERARVAALLAALPPPAHFQPVSVPRSLRPGVRPHAP